ncbi:MAG: hypothetical protein QW393_04300 [Candidatus Micrarchaeaceae archaeon]
MQRRAAVMRRHKTEGKSYAVMAADANRGIIRSAPRHSALDSGTRNAKQAMPARAKRPSIATIENTADL